MIKTTPSADHVDYAEEEINDAWPAFQAPQLF